MTATVSMDIQYVKADGSLTYEGMNLFQELVDGQGSGGGVTNADLADMATGTIKGRVTAGTGSPEDLTGTQATTLLDVFTSALKGLVPASGGGTTNFLRADGTWTTSAPSTSDVLSAIAGASVDAVGTYAKMADQTAAGSGTRTPGSTLAGSSLRFSSSGGASGASGTSGSGTWRCMGFSRYNVVGTIPLSDQTRVTLWLRIS